MDFIYKKYSEEEIRKVINKLDYYDWYYISINQKLSENFIREFKNKINWINISRYQKLSEDFIRDFQDKIDWLNIRYNEELQVSDKFCEEFDEKIGLYNVWLINGKYHRTLGPAIDDEFWYRGKQFYINNDLKFNLFKRWLKLRIFE
jgi:hypothetical protein